MSNATKTTEQVRAEFAKAGVTVTEWARHNGFNRMTVVDVLRGHRKGLRGEAHEVAVALGIKAGDVVNLDNFNPRRKAA